MADSWQDLAVETTIDVPFHDVDMAAIAWHGHYVKYFEVARCILLESFDYNYPQMRESGYFWPIVDMRIKFVNPSHFGQKIKVRATLEEWEHRLKIRYMITDLESGKRLTKGYTTQVAVRLADGEMQFASPSVLAEKLGIKVGG
ncbi:MAG: acyl-CoA thioesterase [Pseudomonadales bacterium]